LFLCLRGEIDHHALTMTCTKLLFINTACLFTCPILDICFNKLKQSYTLTVWIVTCSQAEIPSSGKISTNPNATLIWRIEGFIPQHNKHLPPWVKARGARRCVGKPWIAGGGGTALTSHTRAEATSSVAGAEQEHRGLPPALHQGTLYPPGRLAYGYRHLFNENLSLKIVSHF